MVLRASDLSKTTTRGINDPVGFETDIYMFTLFIRRTVYWQLSNIYLI